MTRRKVSEAARAFLTAPRTIQASTFKATCLELMDEVAARHTEIIVTKHGHPVVKVSPVDPTTPSPFGFLAHSVIGQPDLVSADHDAWKSSPSDPLAGTKR